MGDLHIRELSVADVDAVAALHADSWQRTYRGIFTDAFLDGPVVEDRRRVWADRVAARSCPETAATAATFVAAGVDRPGIVGFVHVVASDPDGPGALIDNLHVDPAGQGRGISTRLLARAARWAEQQHAVSSLHLWVAASNDHAIAVYVHLGAEIDASDVHDDGGGPFEVLRMVWRSPRFAELAARAGDPG